MSQGSKGYDEDIDQISLRLDSMQEEEDLFETKTKPDKEEVPEETHFMQQKNDFWRRRSKDIIIWGVVITVAHLQIQMKILLEEG